MSELHLIVLWSAARKWQDAILTEIGSRLKICRCFEVNWSPERVRKNYIRFYGKKLPSIEAKISECGCGSFLLVVVEDDAPCYEFVETSRGHEIANVNVFLLKTLFRSMTGKGHRIHSSNTPQEFDHDLLLILGIDGAMFKKCYPGFWNGTIEKVRRNFTGIDGWDSISELASVLNSGSRYVILRGIDTDGKIAVNSNHADIDVLTDNAEEFCNLLGGEKHFDEFELEGGVYENAYRGKQVVRIGDRQIIFDVFSTQDSYYDAAWSENMLATRVIGKGLSRLTDENAKFEMLYHIFYHKPEIAAEYEACFPNGFDYAEQFFKLKQFMRSNGYVATKPTDPTVLYNEHLEHIESESCWLMKRLHLEQLVPVQFPQSARRKGTLYFTGVSEVGSVFVKAANCALPHEAPDSEFYANLTAWKENPHLFPRPLRYCNLPQHCAICTEYVDGVTLREYLTDDRRSRDRDLKIAARLYDIAITLEKIGLVHRDIRPENFIVSNSNQVRLIDFQFAVFYDDYSESRYYRRYPKQIEHLGTEEYRAGNYRWDDMHSFKLLLLALQAPKELIDSIARKVGKREIQFPRRYLIKYGIKKFFARCIPLPNLRRRIVKTLKG